MKGISIRIYSHLGIFGQTVMRIRLFYKLFGAFFLVAIGIIGLWIGAFYYKASENFKNFISKFELEFQHELIEELKTIYVRTNSWDEIRDNHVLWLDVLNKLVARKPPPPTNRSRPPHDPDRSPPPRKRRPHPMDEMTRLFRNPDEKAKFRIIQKLLPDKAIMRVVLLDEQKQVIFGRLKDHKQYTLKAIELDDKIIGWLGLRKTQKLTNPLEARFFREQVQLILILGVFILILALIFSFLFSRHLLSPIEGLSKGTKAIANRKFDTRINVNSSDELGELAKAFNQMAQTLDAYEEVRKQWMTDISHELGTPLSVLRGEIEAMQDGIRKADEAGLSSLYSEVMRVSKIVTDLRELSIAETGGLTYEKDEIELSTVINTIITAFDARFARRQITIKTKMTSDGTVMGDYVRLQQVFSNLLENVLRYSDSPGSIEIGTFVKNGNLVCYIQDSGPGVPENALPYLFNRFYRVEKSRNREKGGTGLGLAICKHIIDAHQGEISARNVQGNGLRVEIALPMMQEKSGRQL